MAKIRMGMVGGGEGAFIGAIHRMAAALDGEIELVCGAFSSDRQRSRQFGLDLGLASERSYESWNELIDAEAALPADQRMEFLSIVTPNHLHFPIASQALAGGFDVLSDKPIALDLPQAQALRRIVSQSGRKYMLTHTYTAYPLVAEARRRVFEGQIGTIRKVLVEYTQGWLAQPEEDNKQADWRLDAVQAGVSCCMTDIGSHAFNLAEHVTGLSVRELSAELTAFVPGRTLDDDGSVLLRFNRGAKGVLTASQICIGDENALSLRVYGDKGSLEWHQQEPNTLLLKQANRPTEVIRAGSPYLGSEALYGTRTPSGHPEGYIEAFANIYRAFAAMLRGSISESAYLQNVDAGVRTMAFVDAAVRSSADNGKWCELVS